MYLPSTHIPDDMIEPLALLLVPRPLNFPSLNSPTYLPPLANV